MRSILFSYFLGGQCFDVEYDVSGFIRFSYALLIKKEDLGGQTTQNNARNDPRAKYVVTHLSCENDMHI